MNLTAEDIKILNSQMDEAIQEIEPKDLIDESKIEEGILIYHGEETTKKPKTSPSIQTQ